MSDPNNLDDDPSSTQETEEQYDSHVHAFVANGTTNARVAWAIAAPSLAIDTARDQLEKTLFAIESGMQVPYLLRDVPRLMGIAQGFGIDTKPYEDRHATALLKYIKSWLEEILSALERGKSVNFTYAQIRKSIEDAKGLGEDMADYEKRLDMLYDEDGLLKAPSKWMRRPNSNIY